ncbi:GTP 3',8-cyclase MoaA [Belliella sp. R4-6]|uniref:GTP 3',8-cyclase n=1 Tax=Belliella alkalica TaxID=1730871 RepID=A0ABS9VEC1_9BACT|nr:GTP 3',8-cyclase MoaA [Belliella alkalica]MCH7414799.1 GTP 3',8-cyclase MoaA [Belliella alkalica]
MIIDQFQRKHNYLRISLTDVCNLRCKYCMPNEDYPFMPKDNLMQASEIEQIAKVFVDLGVDKIRLTGGEPMARSDFDDILKRLSKLPISLTLTTNATLLHRYIPQIVTAGVKSINVSLDTLRADKFIKLTKRDKFDLVYKNISLALEAGLKVKLNIVVMKGTNDDEILDFIALTKDESIEVRFIEFMPFEGNKWEKDIVMSKKNLLEMVSSEYEIFPKEKELHDTSEPFGIKGHLGSFAIISTMTAPFCAGCNRMRLTADGKMKNCLFSKGEMDLLTALRSGQDIKSLIHKNVWQKAEKLGGQMKSNSLSEINIENLKNRSMISIGG